MLPIWNCSPVLNRYGVGPILVTKSIKNKKVVKYINLMGQEINPNNTSGIIIEIYDDGTMKKMIR